MPSSEKPLPPLKLLSYVPLVVGKLVEAVTPNITKFPVASVTRLCG